MDMGYQKLQKPRRCRGSGSFQFPTWTNWSIKDTGIRAVTWTNKGLATQRSAEQAGVSAGRWHWTEHRERRPSRGEPQDSATAHAAMWAISTFSCLLFYVNFTEMQIKSTLKLTKKKKYLHLLSKRNVRVLIACRIICGSACDDPLMQSHNA